MPSAEEESLLLAQALSGDGEAFGRLVEPHLGMFHSAILRILGEPADAQDALQEALIALHTQLSRFEGKCKFSTWAYRVCINEALMLRRSRLRRREDSVEDFQPRFGDDGHHRNVESVVGFATEAEALAMAEGRQLRERVQAGLDRLSSEQRAVFILKDLEGWETEDIARHLGISRDLVRQRLHRARLGLRGFLADYAAQVRGGEVAP
jgi:RNA polymerase sigma-70 factor (ECF subfamily)